QLQNKESDSPSAREDATPGTPPKRGADVDRTFNPELLTVAGERVSSKREQKRKGRTPEGGPGPSSPSQSKRPRKYKASD
ncbi:hypothetical protein M569_08019, partial [Genlisea aurea]